MYFPLVPGHIGDGGESRTSMFSLDADIRCNWLTTLKAHQQPITCLDSEGGRILTGSQDHCLKVREWYFLMNIQLYGVYWRPTIDFFKICIQVFRLEDHLPLYTLHGHYGPITCLFIDKISPMTSGSASQDGMLCVWDLVTGMWTYGFMDRWVYYLDQKRSSNFTLIFNQKFSKIFLCILGYLILIISFLKGFPRP